MEFLSLSRRRSSARNVLSDEERGETDVFAGYNQAGFQENIPQELLKYLKQQNLSPVPLLPAMQEIQDNIDDVLSRNDLRDEEKAKGYLHLQNRYLAFKEQLSTRTRPEEIISTVPDLTSRTQEHAKIRWFKMINRAWKWQDFHFLEIERRKRQTKLK